MRRTYRSKKEAGGALDPKDVMQTLDEKSSAFDAFYIQNIKQTKRELSSIGTSNHYGAAASKVRKRKYVKRLVKECEPSVEYSPTKSVFLTPDKSLRLNKGQDLFDQLLNLSSKHENTNSKFGRLFNKLEAKTYKKNLAKIKKYNCSSSDSLESDKENTDKEFSNLQNDTDLRSYELVIEKETKPSPKTLDQSINNIVKRLSAFNRNNLEVLCSSDSDIKSHHDRNRLTTNFQSPTNSPLSSTPFKEKYRSQSIYKFSPIAFNKINDSPNFVTIVEDNDSMGRVNDKNSIDDNPPSPVIPLSIDRSSKRGLSSKSNVISSSSDQPDVTNTEITPKNYAIEISIREISEFQTTEDEPFLGFSNTKAYQNLEDKIKPLEQFVNNSTDTDLDIDESFQVSSNNDQNRSQDTVHNDNLADDETESSYGTCNSEESSKCDDIDVKIPIVILEKLSDSVLQKYMNNREFYDSQHDTLSEKANDSENDEYASFENSKNSSSTSDLHEYVEDLGDTKTCFNTSDLSVFNDTTNNINTNSNSEEERCISFVTTRRRNEVTNDSLILDFNNSHGSESSTECDKTVVSNNKVKMKSSQSPILKTRLSPTVNENPKIENYRNELVLPKPSEKSLVVNYNELSSEANQNKLLLEKSRDINSSNLMSDDTKTGIVLQPGKKWERSLSIYRRMTMQADHFDHSLLDDDQLHTKGRKYRQSVISTMELQDKGLQHNESTISRRSTFVSKPCRSTIRIIKEPNTSRLSLCTTSEPDDLLGFLNEDCDDTIIELSKLSIAESEHEVTVIENFHDTSNRVSTARDYVLRRCGQTDAILFDECYPETVLKNCHKIGEGVYGEVFLWRAGDGRARVMKIVPIAGTTKVNGEHQKDFHEIISEIVIAMELSALRAPIDELQRDFDAGKSVDVLDLHSVENATDVFNKVLAVRCVFGAYPSRLLDLWELYDECKGSENDNPAILPVDQQYIVLELANAGQDLESYEFNSAEQAHALFLQVAFGLAVGEEAFQFEHRDLHWGNVLIAPTDQKFATFVVRGRAHRVPRRGVAATIIDYSLSRLSLPLAGAGDKAALYNDLAADDGLFDAVGDYQFHVYRLMRDKLGNDWKNFEPYTNILWLHYTVDKMITALRYKRTNTKIHKHYIAKLKGIKNRLLDYGSAVQFVLTDNEF